MKVIRLELDTPALLSDRGIVRSEGKFFRQSANAKTPLVLDTVGLDGAPCKVNVAEEVVKAFFGIPKETEYTIMRLGHNPSAEYMYALTETGECVSYTDNEWTDYSKRTVTMIKITDDYGTKEEYFSSLSEIIAKHRLQKKDAFLINSALGNTPINPHLGFKYLGKRWSTTTELSEMNRVSHTKAMKRSVLIRAKTLLHYKLTSMHSVYPLLNEENKQLVDNYVQASATALQRSTQPPVIYSACVRGDSYPSVSLKK